MTSSHAPRDRARNRADHRRGTASATDPATGSTTGLAAGQSGPRPVPLSGLAVPAGGAPVIRRQKADAVVYARDNALGITVSMEEVRAYVTNTANDATLRAGLLAAWNLNSQPRWTIDTPADLLGGGGGGGLTGGGLTTGGGGGGSTNPFHHSNFQEYQDFTTTTQGVSVNAFGGPVSAVYKRGAPKLGSTSKDWGKSKLDDTYVGWVQGLRSGGMSDAAIAQALLDLDDTVLASHLEKRAAAMMTVTVYLAEEWRKQGAAKIYRAILRLIVRGDRTFDDFLDDFAFIGSADLGRRQVGRFYDVWLGDTDRADMDSDEGAIYDVMSPQRDSDYSSDDDMRTDDKKNLKKKRLYAEKHKKR